MIKGLKYGDIVIYKIDGGTSFCLCRLCAKLSDITVTSNLGLSSEENSIYLLSVFYEDASTVKDRLITNEWLKSQSWNIDWGMFPDENILLADISVIEQYVDEKMSKNFRSNGKCPRCGDDGFFVNFGLVCQWHGPYQ